MFNNSGEMIKTFAVTCSVLGIVLSIVCGLAYFEISILLGVLVISIGSLVSRLQYSFMYGFGELIANIAAIKANSDEAVRLLRLGGSQGVDEAVRLMRFGGGYAVDEEPAEPTYDFDSWTCRRCGATNPVGSYRCENCGR